MSYETIDKLLKEPEKTLLLTCNGEEVAARTSTMRREQDHLIIETKGIIRIIPILLTQIKYLK